MSGRLHFLDPGLCEKVARVNDLTKLTDQELKARIRGLQNQPSSAELDGLRNELLRWLRIKELLGELPA